MEQNSCYRCKDLYLAAYIYSQNQEFIRLERDGKVCWFIFGNQQECEQLESLFWANKAASNPRIFADAIKTLKNLIFTG